MTRVLFVGHYLDGTGWAEAARRYALALDAAGLDVVCRPYRLNAHRGPADPRLAPLQGKSARGCRAVVQNVMPHNMAYDGRFGLNVGLYFSETSTVRHTSWPERLNLMDAAWGCAESVRQAALDGGVTAPFSVVPVPCEPEKYAPGRPCPDPVKRLKDRGNFVFYTVGEAVKRKNLPGLLRAFHSEFAPDEPVELLVKTSVPGAPPEVARNAVEDLASEVKRAIRLYGRGEPHHYKREVILADRLSEEEIFSLHEHCDCFVQPSCGEAWSQPAFDAMAMGKTPVVTDWGGYRDYLRPGPDGVCPGWLVPGHLLPVYGTDAHLADLQTGKESWFSPDHFLLRRAMREAFSDWLEDGAVRRTKAAAGVRRAADYSLARVGTTMAGLIDERLENPSG